MFKLISNYARKLSGRDLAWLALSRLRDLHEEVRRAAIIAKEQYLTDLLSSKRYADQKRLEPHGFKVYSQNDEDGIIQEIFRRIGTTNKTFVEFGIGDGLENNTLKLVIGGWHGLWIDGNANQIASVARRVSTTNYSLTPRAAFITAENINTIIGEWRNGEIDLLSIDIDGNDFHVWKAITVIKPRVVAVEYNAKFPPPMSIVQQYNPTHRWNGTDYFGASLEALARLGRELGYSLVGTTVTGVNAFFVRGDLVEDKFQAPFTAENHYNPARYFLGPLYVSGHTAGWGKYVDVPEKATLEDHHRARQARRDALNGDRVAPAKVADSIAIND